jgi:hypothetical protein
MAYDTRQPITAPRLPRWDCGLLATNKHIATYNRCPGD